MKARVLKLFQDKYTKEWYIPNRELELTKERFDEILEVDKLVEEIKEDSKVICVDAKVEKLFEEKSKKKK